MATPAVKRAGLLGTLAVGLIGLGLEQYRRAQEERQRNPVGGPKLARVRVGMPVQTIDEITLGTLVAI